MRRFFLLSLLFVSLLCTAQDSLKSLHDSIPAPGLVSSDSLLEPAQTSSTDLMDQNLRSFMREQESRRAAQKKKAFMYLGLGVFFLVVLIVGLRRKRKIAAK